MTTAPDGRPLAGSVVRLDPTVPDDAPGLLGALDDPRVWRLGFAFGAASPSDVQAMRSVTGGYVRSCVRDARIGKAA